MSYCLNPSCQTPQNPAGNKFCQNCGTRLLLGDRYRAIKIIGQGGFGRTFLAVDEYKPSKPRCVIKQFFTQAQGTSNVEKAAELFAQEAVRLDELGKHPQIPELLAFLTQDNRQYLVQEFIDGQNLGQELEEKGAFKEEGIQHLLKELLPVLQFIHNNKVIHRDIKPENIIRRTSDRQLILVDFGAAKFTTGTTLAKTGTVIGSAGYVAPEQAIGRATFASDIYSLGVTCIHLLTHITPFDLYSLTEGAWVWPDYLTSPVSNTLTKVINKMLEGAVNQRYQLVDEILKDLSFPSISTVTQPQNISIVKPLISTASPSQNQPWKCVQTLIGHSGLWAAVRSVAFSPDGSRLASGSEDNTIKIWNLETGQESRTLAGHSNWVWSVTFSPNGELLASSSYDNTIKIWDLKTGQEIRTLIGHSDWVRSVIISRDGKTLASGGNDKVIKLWNLHTGEQICTLTGHTNSIHTIAFSPDDQKLASGCWDYTIKLWNVKTQEQAYTMPGHSNIVRAIAFTPDGQILISGSDDKSIKLWNLENGEQIRTIFGHTKAVTSIAIHPNGQTFASASDDRTIKLWELATGQEIGILTGHSHYITSVTFSPDGQTIASGSCDKTIKIWRMD